jgi:hypothetical protein
MTLAAAMTSAFGFTGSLKDFCRNDAAVRQLTVIEINPAKNLPPLLQTLPKHALHSFPQFDMPRMSFADSSIDDAAFRHSGARSRPKGRFERVRTRFETGRPFVFIPFQSSLAD